MTDLIPPAAEDGFAPPVPDRPWLVWLDDPRARGFQLVGGKAAALARARAHGLPVLPGAVLTTAACETVDRGMRVEELEILDDAARVAERIVARSSSVIEDTAESSAAGQFVSVLDLRGSTGLAEGVRTVLASRERAGVAGAPIAVLVQPFIEPRISGVLFGIDPVTGRSDRMVITAVAGHPEGLVSGTVDGSLHVIERDGGLVELDIRDGVELHARQLRSLATLASQAAVVFGGPQDIEWAEVGGELVMLQSRPITTESRGVPSGPVYGPGPVAETFPERLRPLEADLWVPPLRDAVREALHLAGAIPDSQLDEPDLVVSVDGRVAIDLERTGEIPRRERRPPWFAVAARVRRLRSAWRVGRLRSALPALGNRLVDRVDADLEHIPPLDEMTDRQLVALLGRSRAGLRSLHAHEVLMGLLADADASTITAASVAMRVLGEARSDGQSDEDIIAQSPVVLALTPPRIGRCAGLPPRSTMPDLFPGRGDVPADRRSSSAAVAREALRLRARWVHELSGRAAWTLGQRLQADGRLPDASHVPYLSYEELILLVTRRADVAVDLLSDRRRRHDEADSPPLPARFRISDQGRPIADRTAGESGGGTGASGGRATGPVTHDTHDPPAGSILVVRTLSPGIGPLLTRLAGVVSETGSVLAHLAILAREAGVPAVVGHAGALDDFTEGSIITVDGTTGRITRVDAALEDRGPAAERGSA